MSIIKDSVLDIASQVGGSSPGAGTITDKTRFDNNLTITGMTWTQLPTGLWVMEFDGTNDYAIKLNPSFAKDLRGTISLWLKPANGTSDILCYSKASTGNVDEFRFQRAGGSGVEYFRLHAQVNYATIYTLDTGAGTAVDGTWYNFVITSNGSATLFYLAGASTPITVTAGVANGTWFGDFVTDANQLTIGALARSNSYISDFEGQIALVRLFSYAITPAQVRAHYHSQKWLFGVAS
ncbi:hypothetical protein CMI37_02700 [Candidatus Pacearchaeota archaeon]|nr:hypothetical protein [Candidatus Pacearchaeota archaeon]